MLHRYLPVMWLALSVVCTSCTSRNMDRARITQCAVGAACVVEGQLIATKGKGRIEDESGCIAVALPTYVDDDWNLQRVKASGSVYKAPDYPGLITYTIRDRVFDAEACYSGLAMYVDQIEQSR